MSLFSEIEKSIERGFRNWTERVFGPAESDQLLLTHHAILDEIETRIETVARGRRVFPYARLAVTLFSADPGRRALYQTAFAEQGRLEADIRKALEGAGCQISRGFSVEVLTGETGPRAFEIEYGVEAKPAEKVKAPAAARLIAVRGKAAKAEYALVKQRTNIGRLAELTDSDQRVVRRNDIVFEEGADEANATVSRSHAHIRFQAGEYRICDDESQYGTRVFRDGRPIEVPSGDRRGERLRHGDEIYLGRACVRFEQE